MANLLAEETSPYLRQHADNPVHWQAWNADALELARSQDKPILLSIGYSACHWCHVMAHESFEDERTAAVMNAYFVNIKVDREERPDIDKIYQLAYQVMNQRGGGWPLTIMLDPKTQAPFMAGTYFPKQASHGIPAFTDVLRQVAEWYSQNKGQLVEQKQQLDEVFAKLEPEPSVTVGDHSPLVAAREQLASSFDSEHGGFSGAPKFPHPSSLELLLRLGRRGDQTALDMAHFSLRIMCERGLFDQVGGGFYRYCVDERWAIPHFEKMLYDNGPLLELCSTEVSASETFASAVADTTGWVMREMQSPEGGYFASLDADSEGEEGRYYVWSNEQIQSTLTNDTQLGIVNKHYGLDAAPNFEGRWHFNIATPLSAIAKQLNLSEDSVREMLDAARTNLLQQRQTRIAPDRDEKILTAWNALMIQGMAGAYQSTGREEYLQSARQARDFLANNLWSDNRQRLLASYKDGHANLGAYLDDYVYLIDALLTLMQAHWHTEDCLWAQALAEQLLNLFEDKQNGGFFFTTHDHEQLLHRPKPLADESTASGNAIAVRVLLRLGYLLGEKRYLDAAERTLKYARSAIEKFPLAHTSLSMALDDYLQPPEIVIIRGDVEVLADWQQQAFATDRLVFAIPGQAENLPEALAAKKSQAKTVAYICKGFECSPPITELEQLQKSR